MQPLTLSFVQTDTRWHAPQANRERFARWFDLLPDDATLVVLPEMFSTGFTMSARELAEPMNGPTLSWLQSQSQARGLVVCGSLIIEEEGSYYNRFVWVTPSSVAYYDKRHLFRMAREQDHYRAGRRRLVVRHDGWRVCPAICYDLRFPVWLRNRGDYDVLLCVANWPASRRDAWSTLLRARAIENQSYVVGVNVVGEDGNGVSYAGDSAAYGPAGESLMDARDAMGVFTVTLDGTHLSDYRAGFPAWQDADAFNLADGEGETD